MQVLHKLDRVSVDSLAFVPVVNSTADNGMILAHAVVSASPYIHAYMRPYSCVHVCFSVIYIEPLATGLRWKKLVFAD